MRSDSHEIFGRRRSRNIGLGLVLGAFGAASVIGSFLFGWPSIIAVIISFVVFDRPPLPLELAGGAIVIVGVLYGQIARMRGAR